MILILNIGRGVLGLYTKYVMLITVNVLLIGYWRAQIYGYLGNDVDGEYMFDTNVWLLHSIYRSEHKGGVPRVSGIYSKMPKLSTAILLRFG